MQKIGDITSSANAEGEFTEGNPAGGTPPTLLKAAWLNTLQRELSNAIEGFGEPLDSNNDSQLLQCLTKLLNEASDWANLKQIPPALQSMSRVVRLASSTTLTQDQMGLVLINASNGSNTVTLPPADDRLGIVDVLLRRTDNTGNRITIQTTGDDRVKFATHLNPVGYHFFVLMGSGDWWHLRSDGDGSWWPVGRFDTTPLGQIAMESTVHLPPGGYGIPNGTMLNRAEWPWLWDHAAQSGIITVEEQRIRNDGCWTVGDGFTTFRLPEVRGEFLRVSDEYRGVDSGRAAGSWQDGTWIRTIAQEWTGSDAQDIPGEIGTAFASPDSTIKNAGPRGVLPSNALSPSGESAFRPEVTDNTVRGTTGINVWAVNNWIRVRPRNTAYPARIKLI